MPSLAGLYIDVPITFYGTNPDNPKSPATTARVWLDKVVYTHPQTSTSCMVVLVGGAALAVNTPHDALLWTIDREIELAKGGQ